MNVYDSMQNPRVVMMSPTVPAVPSPGFASPGETVITVGRHTPVRRQQQSPPKLLNTCKNVRGMVDIMVYKIEGFSDSAGMMDRTDPYVRYAWPGAVVWDQWPASVCVAAVLLCHRFSCRVSFMCQLFLSCVSVVLLRQQLWPSGHRFLALASS